MLMSLQLLSLRDVYYVFWYRYRKLSKNLAYPLQEVGLCWRNLVSPLFDQIFSISVIILVQPFPIIYKQFLKTSFSTTLSIKVSLIHSKLLSLGGFLFFNYIFKPSWLELLGSSKVGQGYDCTHVGMWSGLQRSTNLCSGWLDVGSTTTCI